MNINKNSPSPIYKQIELWMERAIKSGEWPVHFKIKSEEDIARELSVNRGTVRKSIGNLIKKELLVQVHGKGTFVSSGKPEQPIAQRLVSFAEAMKEQGLPFTTHILQKSVVIPPQPILSHLCCTEGQKVLFLKRIRTVHDEPSVLLENYVVLNRCQGLESIDFKRVTLFDAMEKYYGIRITWGRRDFEAVSIEAPRASDLGLAVGTPVLYLTQITYDQDNTPVEFSNVWLRGDNFKLSSILKR